VKHHPVLSETDRLSATIQTDQEESEIFIRSQEVRAHAMSKPHTALDTFCVHCEGIDRL